jgi:hypothetical protein
MLGILGRSKYLNEERFDIVKFLLGESLSAIKLQCAKANPNDAAFGVQPIATMFSAGHLSASVHMLT